MSPFPVDQASSLVPLTPWVGRLGPMTHIRMEPMVNVVILTHNWTPTSHSFGEGSPMTTSRYHSTPLYLHLAKPTSQKMPTTSPHLMQPTALPPPPPPPR